MWNTKAKEYALTRKISEVDRKVVDLIIKRHPEKVVEYGIGPGIVAELLLEKAEGQIKFYRGYDIISDFIQMSRQKLARFKKTKVIVEYGDLGENEEDESCDVILVMTTLHHLEPKNQAKKVESIYRKLRNLGLFVLVEDWAFYPRNSFESAALALRKMMNEQSSSPEFHMSEFWYYQVLLDVGFVVVSTSHIGRNPDCWLLNSICDKTVKELQRYLRLAPPAVRIPMTIFCAEKRN